jgi:hypothetical protein
MDKMSKSIKVRFNLGAGKNFMKWKVEYPDKRTEYFEPDKFQLVMKGCVLKNHKKTATKIFEGSHKVVCAWILCKDIEVLSEPIVLNDGQRITYNPRIQPNWTYDGGIVDDNSFNQLHTINRGVFISK